MSRKRREGAERMGGGQWLRCEWCWLEVGGFCISMHRLWVVLTLRSVRRCRCGRRGWGPSVAQSPKRIAVAQWVLLRRVGWVGVSSVPLCERGCALTMRVLCRSDYRYWCWSMPLISLFKPPQAGFGFLRNKQPPFPFVFVFLKTRGDLQKYAVTRQRKRPESVLCHKNSRRLYESVINPPRR